MCVCIIERPKHITRYKKEPIYSKNERKNTTQNKLEKQHRGRKTDTVELKQQQQHSEYIPKYQK